MEDQIFEIRALYTSNTPLEIRLSSFNKELGREVCILNNSGTYVYFKGPAPDDNPNVVKIPLPLSEPQGQKQIFYTRIKILDADSIKEDKDKAQENANNKLVVDFVRNHRQVLHKNLAGVNVNKNIKPDIVMFEIRDVTGTLVQKTQEEKTLIDALAQIKSWSNDKPEMLVRFAYTWGIRGIEAMNNEQLFDRCVSDVKANVKRFAIVMGWLGDEVAFAVKKGLLTKVGDEVLIYRNGNYLMFNGQPVGASDDEAINHFKLHDQDFKLLQNSLGIKGNSPNIKLEDAKQVKVPVNDTTHLSAKLQGASRSNVQIKFEDRIRKVLLENKNVLLDKVQNRFLQIEEGQQENVLSELSKSDQIIAQGLDAWFWEIVEKTRKEVLVKA